MKNSRTNPLKEYRKRINYYKFELNRAPCPFKRQLLENALLHEIDHVLCYIDTLNKDIEHTIEKETLRQKKEFTLQDLSTFDGTLEKPAYVAVNSIVYDVSNEPTWGGASHFGLLAGRDLSTQFESCHKAEAILSKLPKVGVLK